MVSRDYSDIKMKQASIDLGTNTCLLLICESTPQGEIVLHDESNVVRLGHQVDQTKELQSEAMDRTIECLVRYATIVKANGLDASAVVAVATAQARDAKNAETFFQKIEKNIGFHFRVLSGDEEATATFLGALLSSTIANQTCVIDIGGGSTEIVSEKQGKSLNIGAVRMTERFLKSDPVTDEEFWACERAIDLALEEMIPLRNSFAETPSLVAVAGTAVTLAMLQLAMPTYKRDVLDGFILTRGDAHRLVEELKWRSIEERKLMPGMEAKRGDVILAGALIFWRTMEKLNFRTATISTRGLRYGVLKG
jgi:exopolyphosphatase/guanosine-5'-triphosphate,3'-diphosphate pyrophosphatase